MLYLSTGNVAAKFKRERYSHTPNRRARCTLTAIKKAEGGLAGKLLYASLVH